MFVEHKVELTKLNHVIHWPSELWLTIPLLQRVDVMNTLCRLLRNVPCSSFMHQVTEQSQRKKRVTRSRGKKRLLRDGNALSWQDGAEANVNVAAGQETACLPAHQNNLGHSRRSVVGHQRGHQSASGRAAVTESKYVFFFYKRKAGTSCHSCLVKISEKPTSGQGSKHWFPAADKGNVTVFAFNVSGLILLSPDLVTSGWESDREFITIPVLSVLLCLLTALWRHLGSISGATSFTNQLLAQSLGVSRR